MQSIKEYWESLDESTRENIISAWDTFISTFATCVFVAVEAGVQWTWAFWGGVIGMAARAGLKSLRQKYAPVSLGGKKK